MNPHQIQQQIHQQQQQHLIQQQIHQQQVQQQQQQRRGGAYGQPQQGQQPIPQVHHHQHHQHPHAHHHPHQPPIGIIQPNHMIGHPPQTMQQHIHPQQLPQQLHPHQPPHPHQPQQIPQHIQQQHNIASHQQQFQGKLKKYELQRPDKKDLGLGLGPPDFYPLDSNSKEDTLSQEYILGGFCERYSHDENRSSISSFRNTDFSKIKEQLLQSVYEVEWKKSSCPSSKAGIVSVNNNSNNSSSNNPGGASTTGSSNMAGGSTGGGKDRLVIKKPVPELKAWSTNHREGWVVKLAQSQEPLHKLAQSVPHGYKGETLLKMFLDNQVPLIRATWYTKIVYGNMPKHKTTEPSGDWTKIIVQSLFAYVRNNTLLSSSGSTNTGDSINPQKRMANYTGLHYIERLLRWNFSEGLLNKDVLLSMLIDHLNETERPDESVIIANLLLYYSDTLIHSSYLSNRFLTKSNDKIQKILNPTGQQPQSTTQPILNINSATISHTNQKVLNILYIILKQISITLPDIFITFKYFKDLLLLIYQSNNNNNLLTKKDNISFTISPEDKWESFFLNELNVQHNITSNNINSNNSNSNSNNNNINNILKKNYLDYSDLIQSFDKFIINLDLKSLYKDIFQNQISLEDDKDKIMLICEWACTPCRNSSYSYLSASSLLAIYEKNLIIKNNFEGTPFIKTPLQNVLVYYLEKFNSYENEESAKRICYFYSELIRIGVFSQNSYARYIISRGILENHINNNNNNNHSNENNLMNHRYFLGEFPIYNLNDFPTNDIQQQRNQRRTILYANTIKSQDEINNLEYARESIKKFILNDNSSYSNIIELISKLPYYSQSSLTEWLSLCIRANFKQHTNTSNTTIDNLIKNSKYFSFPLTSNHIDKCFKLMESVQNTISILQCLLVFWENWRSLLNPILKSYIYYSTCKFELAFISANKFNSLLDSIYSQILNNPQRKKNKLDTSDDEDSDEDSEDSDGEYNQSNNNNNNNNNDSFLELYFNDLLHKFKSIKLISSWISKRKIQIKIKEELSNLNTQIINNFSSGGDIYNQSQTLLNQLINNNSKNQQELDTLIIKLIEEFDLFFKNLKNKDQTITQQDCSTLVLVLIFNNCIFQQPSNNPNHCKILILFLCQFCFSFPMNMNIQELFCNIFKEILINNANNNNMDSNNLITFTNLIINHQFIDPYYLILYTILPILQNQSNNSSTNANTSNQLIFQLLFKIIDDFKFYSFSKIKSLSLLFPILCKLYDPSHNANEIREILNEKDFKYIFFINDSQKQIDILKEQYNLSPITIRYLYYSILANNSNQNNNLGFYKYEQLTLENVIDYSYQLINHSLSNSWNCYWNIQLSYLELSLLLEEWSTLPPLTLTPPSQSPSHQSQHSQPQPSTITPESLITQFILNHFEQNKGWEKIFIYQNLFLVLPQQVLVKNEFLRLTTVIMESQYSQECFESPEEKMYLFSHILINLPIRKLPSQLLSVRDNTLISKDDEILLQDSFTELTIHILETFEETSINLQAFVLSIEKQLVQFLQFTSYYESLNIPSQLLDSILQSLSMRISLLIPLVNTIKACKLECKLEDISITLLNLLGRFIIQSDEEYQFFDCILTILDLLLSDRYDPTLANINPSTNPMDIRYQIKRKLYDHYQKIKSSFSNSFQVKIEKQLSFLINSTISVPFSIIQPPTVQTILQNPSFIKSKEIIPSEIKPTITQMDPWSLLEDYTETPLSPSVFGGVKLERKDLTYIKSSFPTKNMVIIPNEMINLSNNDDDMMNLDNNSPINIIKQQYLQHQAYHKTSNLPPNQNNNNIKPQQQIPQQVISQQTNLKRPPQQTPQQQQQQQQIPNQTTNFSNQNTYGSNKQSNKKTRAI